MRTIVFLLLASTMVACQATGEANLKDAMYEYNRGIRWNRIENTAAYMSKEQAAAYMTRRESLSDLRITAMRVRNVRFHGDERATATVAIQWYRLGQGRLQSTVLLQAWHQKSKRGWVIENHRWLGGAPLPLFATTKTKRPQPKSGT